ncbi:MAG: DUF2953 domain-containing protein [Bacillota bacterium]|nr:DUF2953 domain-containing protein [Bacillota bacterium]
MIVVLFIFIIIALIFVLLFNASLKARFIFDTEESDMHLTLLWLPPLFKAIVEMVNARPVFTIIVLNKKVYTKVLKGKKQTFNKRQLLDKVNPEDFIVNAYYGFSDPFTTGIATGVMSMLSGFADIASINHCPDFTSSKDYIYVDATAKINLGSALLNLLRP